MQVSVNTGTIYIQTDQSYKIFTLTGESKVYQQKSHKSEPQIKIAQHSQISTKQESKLKVHCILCNN